MAYQIVESAHGVGPDNRNQFCHESFEFHFSLPDNYEIPCKLLRPLIYK